MERYFYNKVMVKKYSRSTLQTKHSLTKKFRQIGASLLAASSIDLTFKLTLIFPMIELSSVKMLSQNYELNYFFNGMKEVNVVNFK